MPLTPEDKVWNQAIRKAARTALLWHHAELQASMDFSTPERSSASNYKHGVAAQTAEQLSNAILLLVKKSPKPKRKRAKPLIF